MGNSKGTVFPNLTDALKEPIRLGKFIPPFPYPPFMFAVGYTEVAESRFPFLHTE